MTFIEVRQKRAKDLNNTDVIYADFPYRDESGLLTSYSGWTEVLGVYASEDELFTEYTDKFWDYWPEAKKYTDNLEGWAKFVMVRVVVPPASYGGEVTDAWLGFYGYDLVKVQDRPVVLPYEIPRTGPEKFKAYLESRRQQRPGQR